MGSNAVLDTESATAGASAQHDKQLTDGVAVKGDHQIVSCAVQRKRSVEQEPQRRIRLLRLDCCALSMHIRLAPHLVS